MRLPRPRCALTDDKESHMSDDLPRGLPDWLGADDLVGLLGVTEKQGVLILDGDSAIRTADLPDRLALLRREGRLP
jgi:hypothetical protein